MIWIRAWELQRKLDRKTLITHSQVTAGYGSRLIAFLKQFQIKLRISDRFRRQSFDAENEAVKIQKRS